MLRLLFIATALAALNGSSALADCRIMSFRFYFSQNDSVSTTGVSTGGSRCRMPIRAGSSSEFTSVAVVTRPGHGSLTELRAYRFNYQPAPGFRGADQYAIRVCGKSARGEGCSTITYNITVQ